MDIFIFLLLYYSVNVCGKYYIKFIYGSEKWGVINIFYKGNLNSF